MPRLERHWSTHITAVALAYRMEDEARAFRPRTRPCDSNQIPKS